MIIDKIVQVADRQQWREWLSDHHGTEEYCWLVSDNATVGYLDFVEEALCFGWIDSTRVVVTIEKHGSDRLRVFASPFLFYPNIFAACSASNAAMFSAG
ncbi:YdeI family protein [Cohnella suwonensis]|uniref:YdeI family protein n=1 Tax=Cohnella suwonensis TaxID=696072 RepID=A0ABW0LTG7_9BACL